MQDDTTESWAGGADLSAAKAEIDRLKKLGEQLREVTAEARRISDPAELAALQDRNIQAFERMTAEMGLAALDRMRATLAALRDPSRAAEIAQEAAEKNAGLLAAARAEIEAARDAETQKLIRGFTERLREAASRGAQAAAQSSSPHPDMEPFDGGERGPTPEEAERSGDGPEPLAEMPAEAAGEEEEK